MRNTSVFCLCNKNEGPSRYKGGFNMASYTQHYQLHQWEPSDDFLRTDFNDDFKKIDTAIKTTEQTLQTNFNGEVSRLDTALSAAQQTLQNNLNTQVTRLDTALSTAQQTLRSEFNSSIQQVNTTLASIQALAEGRANIVFGTYTGDGTKNRLINLGITPKWVLLFPELGDYSNGSGGLCAPGHPIVSKSDAIHMMVGGTKIQVSENLDTGSNTNMYNTVYYYLAAI